MIIDIHAHVLPGIDDGAKDFETSLQMLEASFECGVTQIIATPHYLPWRKGASPEKIRQLCREIQKKLQTKRGISMDIYPGNEIYYSLEVVEDLKTGKALTLADSRYVLIEFELSVSYQTMCRAVKDLRDNGYFPIIAHVERYSCTRQLGRMEELRKMGAKFQANIGVLKRNFLDSNANWAKTCLKKGFIDFIASDMHDMAHRSPMSEGKMGWLERHLTPTYQAELLYDNSKKIIGGTKA